VDDADFYPCCQSQTDAMDSATQFDIINLTTSTKYFHSKPTSRQDGNPRGKYPRKPLSWPGGKLPTPDDLKEHRDKIWREQQQQDVSSLNDYSDDEDNVVESDTATQPSSKNIKPKKKKGKRKTNVRGTGGARRKRSMIQTDIVSEPHILTAMEALDNRQGIMRCGCHCGMCKMRHRDWRTMREVKQRDWNWRLSKECEAIIYEHLDYCYPYDEDFVELLDCWISEGEEPDMRDLIRTSDGAGFRAYRLRESRGEGFARGGREGTGNQVAGEKTVPLWLQDESASRCLVTLGSPNNGDGINNAGRDMDDINVEGVSEDEYNEWDHLDEMRDSPGDRDSSDGRIDQGTTVNQNGGGGWSLGRWMRAWLPGSNRGFYVERLV